MRTYAQTHSSTVHTFGYCHTYINVWPCTCKLSTDIYSHKRTLTDSCAQHCGRVCVSMHIFVSQAKNLIVARNYIFWMLQIQIHIRLPKMARMKIKSSFGNRIFASVERMNDRINECDRTELWMQKMKMNNMKQVYKMNVVSKSIFTLFADWKFVTCCQHLVACVSSAPNAKRVRINFSA